MGIPLDTTPQKVSPSHVLNSSKPIKANQSTSVTVNPQTNQVVPNNDSTDITKNIKWQQPKVLVKAEGAHAPKKGAKFKGFVIDVNDGDGAKVLQENGSYVNCRLWAIDAPEVKNPYNKNKPGQPMGDESAKALRDRIENKEVTVYIEQPITSKNYDRAVCRISIEGKDVSMQQVLDGMAEVYSMVKLPLFLQGAEIAKKHKRGIHSLDNYESPRNYRKRTNSIDK